ncbi:MAG: hypothetical protein JST00_16905 [Deltaproteobacteria bacterium]|nr:hypothetical protein [Deltaproteobacteria bacterium]
MGTMVAGFAHEVRNPLAVLRSLSEELLDELGQTPLAATHVSVMLQMVERIERLVRTSLKFGRPTAPRRERHRPEGIVSTALLEVRHRVRAMSGTIRIEIEPDLPMVAVDDAQIAQALSILVHNALDATSHASEVSIRVTTKPEQPAEGAATSTAGAVVFQVTDHGPGIPEELLGRIFDPFFTTKPAGTGLGLAIASQIVSENGARLGVESAPSVTTFTITVPT